MLFFKDYLDTIIQNKQTYGNTHCCVLGGTLHGLLFEHVVPANGAVWKFGESMGGRDFRAPSLLSGLSGCRTTSGDGFMLPHHALPPTTELQTKANTFFLVVALATKEKK